MEKYVYNTDILYLYPCCDGVKPTYLHTSSPGLNFSNSVVMCELNIVT